MSLLMIKGAFPTAELMMAEAVGLVSTLDSWRVLDKIIMSTKVPEKKRIFGKGNFQSLTGIRVEYISLKYTPLICVLEQF